jgi:hypothetical protein
MTRGQRRVVIVSLDQERPWLRGEVEFFEDEDWTSPPAELRDRALRSFRELREATIHMGSEFRTAEPEADNPTPSFQLAEAVDDLDFQSMLLRSRSESERLRRFIQFTQEFIPRKQYAARMKRLAPLNGSGHRPADL